MLDSLLLICPGIYPQNFSKSSMSCDAYLLLSQKKQRRGRIFSNFTNAKGETFSFLMITKLLLEVISQCGFNDKGLPLPFSLAKKRIHLDTQLNAELLICFESYQGIPCSHQAESRQ